MCDLCCLERLGAAELGVGGGGFAMFVLRRRRGALFCEAQTNAVTACCRGITAGGVLRPPSRLLADLRITDSKVGI